MPEMQTARRPAYEVDPLGVLSSNQLALEANDVRYDRNLLSGAGTAISSPIQFFKAPIGKNGTWGRAKTVVETNVRQSGNLGQHCWATIYQIVVSIAMVGNAIGTPDLVKKMRAIWEDSLLKFKVSNNLELREPLMRLGGAGLSGYLGSNGGQPQQFLAPAPVQFNWIFNEPIAMAPRQPFECEIVLNSNESGGAFTPALGEDLVIGVYLEGNFTRRVND